MRILLAHNAYQQRGGEDAVVDDEIRLLQENDHIVELYGRDNQELAGMPPLLAAQNAVWAKRTQDDMAALIDRFQPDIVHAHNTFPLISPSLYWSAAKRNIPIVQTLHNFRLLCPQAMLLRNGSVCEDCVGKMPWRGVAHRCYRNSLAQSAVLASMLMIHRSIGTYEHKITRYIALNEFCRAVFARGGLPPNKLRVKPNFVTDPGPSAALRSGFLYVGRLSVEKGVATLANALASAPELLCEVVGTGPEASVIHGLINVNMVGWRQCDYVNARMQQSLALVMPSIWYENFPRTLVEAFACGLPVIASRLGAMAALIRDGETGLLFEPGNSMDLAQKLTWAQANPRAMQAMGQAARQDYEMLYTPAQNIETLVEIYNEAISESQQA